VERLLTGAAGARVLVIDDGSTDGTADVARAAGATVIQHSRNSGYGSGLKTGIRAAETPIVAIFDADAQHRVEDLVRLVGAIGEHDTVIGARSSASHQPFLRRPGKWMLQRTASMLVGQKIPDLNSGLRVFRREIIARYLHLLPDGFSASTTSTICLLQRGYDVAFLPITVDKRVGKSTVRQVRDGVRTIYLMVNLIVLFNPTRFFLPPAGVLIAVGLIYGVIRTITQRLGVPTLALLMISMGMITGMFGLLAKQISSLRCELFEKDIS